MTQLRSGAATDVGRRRQKNDDTTLVDDRLFAVADGMGGYVGGDVASITAVEALRNAFAATPTSGGLQAAVVAAGRAVVEKSTSDPDLRQMGTTMSAVALVDEGDGAGEVFAIAHIGDSRIYLLRDGELSQLTDDHTVPEDLKRAGRLSDAEAAVDPRRHIITRVLGPSSGHEPDMQTLVPYAGDRLLLCSDGLSDEVNDAQIATTLRTVGDPGEAARRLVELANRNGGKDNISVVIVDVVNDDDRAGAASAALATEPPPPRHASTRRGLMTADERNAQLRSLGREDDVEPPWDTGADPIEAPARRFTLRVVVFVVVLLVVIGGAIGAITWYARSSYFVGLDEGHVAIFKGRPGGLLVFEPEVVETTDLTQAAVPPARVEDVEKGHTVASLEDAHRYVNNLRRDSEIVSGTTPTTTPPDATGETTTTVP